MIRVRMGLTSRPTCKIRSARHNMQRYLSVFDCVEELMLGCRTRQNGMCILRQAQCINAQTSTRVAWEQLWLFHAGQTNPTVHHLVLVSGRQTCKVQPRI